MAAIIYFKSGAGRRIARIATAAAEAEVTAGTAKRILRGTLYTRIGTAAAVAPTVTTAPVLVDTNGGVVAVGDVITCTPGVYTGGATITRQWKSGAANVGTGALTYTLVAGDAGKSITVVETATNAAGNVQSTSNAIAVP